MLDMIFKKKIAWSIALEYQETISNDNYIEYFKASWILDFTIEIIFLFIIVVLVNFYMLLKLNITTEQSIELEICTFYVRKLVWKNPKWTTSSSC